MRGSAHLLFSFCILYACASHIAEAQMTPQRGDILITHLSPDYGQASDECVVLYNATAETVDVNAFELRYYTASGSAGGAGRLFTSATLLPPHGHLLLSSRDTVHIGGLSVPADGAFSSGMATSGGQLVFRSTDQPDSVIYAVAWGTVAGYVGGMSDAAPWNGDGLIALTWSDTAYVRTAFNTSNLQYQHIPSDSVSSLPSLGTGIATVPPMVWSISVHVRQGSSLDTSVRVGMIEGATDGFDPSYDLPKPPPPAGDHVTAGIFRPDMGLTTGSYLLRDIVQLRSLADTTSRWTLDIFPANTIEPLDLTFRIEGLPLELPVRLLDPGNTAFLERTADSLHLGFLPASTGPRRFVLVVGDSTPPAVTFLAPREGEAYAVGSDVAIRLNVAEASGLDTFVVAFRNTETGQTLGVTTNAATDFAWAAPGRLLTDAGRFTLLVRDSMGNGAEYQSPVFRLVPDTARRMFSPGWHLVSVPLDPIEAAVGDLSVFSVADSFYLFGYTPNGGYFRADSVESGRGYFVGLLDAGEFAVPGRSVAAGFRTNLRPGFALISVPARMPVALQDLIVQVGTEVMSHADAVASARIANVLFRYDHDGGSYVFADSLHPWDAYWIPVLAESLAIGYPDSIVTGAGGRLRKAAGGWEVCIYAVADEAVDSLFALGAHPDASSGFDPRFDLPAPPGPPMTPGVRVFARHPEWGLPVGERFVREIRGTGREEAWIFTVAGGSSGDILLRAGSMAGRIPDGIMIEDMGHPGVLMPLTPTWTYKIVGHQDRSFRVTQTTSDVPSAENTPEVFVLEAPFPNPFNSATTFRFSLPGNGRFAFSVFDVIGRSVFTVPARDYTAGRYMITWEAAVSTGTYYAVGLFVPATGHRRAARRIVRGILLR